MDERWILSNLKSLQSHRSLHITSHQASKWWQKHLILGIGLCNCATLLSRTLNYFVIDKTLIPILVLSLTSLTFGKLMRGGKPQVSWIKKGDFCLITVNVESDTLNCSTGEIQSEQDWKRNNRLGCFRITNC